MEGHFRLREKLKDVLSSDLVEVAIIQAYSNIHPVVTEILYRYMST